MHVGVICNVVIRSEVSHLVILRNEKNNLFAVTERRIVKNSCLDLFSVRLAMFTTFDVESTFLGTWQGVKALFSSGRDADAMRDSVLLKDFFRFDDNDLLLERRELSFL